MRILVCGGRENTNRKLIFETLDRLHKGNKIDFLVHGGARGADSIAGEWADDNNVESKRVTPDYNRYGRYLAPKKRNQSMLEFNPDIVIAFEGGGGTQDMIERSTKAKIPVYQIFS